MRRKIYSLLFFWSALITSSLSYGQSASSYGFTASTGTYTEVSPSATQLTSVQADQAISSYQNIGFNFVYEGITYTQFKMSSNGFISLGSGTSSLSGNNFSTLNTSSRPIIAPLWDDLAGNATGGSYAGYEVTGTAPNQVLTVEWRNWEWNWSSSSPVISFQAKLYEATGNIEFVYRQESGNINSGSASIGIGSASGSGSGSYLNLTSVANPAVSSTSSVTNINTKPATGQIYTFINPPPCSGKPFAGMATASSPVSGGSVCANTSFSLNTAGATVASGFTYEWQSNNGSGWVATGGTNQSYMVTGGINTATDYRLIVTCVNTNDRDTSNVVSLTVSPFYNCYCIPSSNCTNDGIINVTIGTLNNTSPMCSGGYSDFKGLGSQVTVSQGQQVTISVTDSINSNPASAGVWIDYDHNSTFDSSEFTLLGISNAFNGTKMPVTFTANINISSLALTGVTAMRVRAATSTGVAPGGSTGPCATGVYGEFEDYLITINPGAPCNGMPTGGTVSSSLTSIMCPTPFTLSATGYTTGVTGLVFQWQESTNNFSYTNLGAATPDYTDIMLPFISQTMYYRLQVTCTNGTGLVAYSDTVSVAFTSVNTFPWLYDVETQNTTTNSNITQDCWTSSPSNTSNAFRWDVDASGGTPSSSTGPSGAYSGNKYYYTEASNGSQGDSARLMLPPMDLSSLTVPQFAFYYHMYGAAIGRLIVQIDNGNGWVSLDSLVGQQQTATNNPWRLKTVNLSGYTGTVYLRFVAIRGNSFTGDMSLDNIIVRETPSCPAPQGPTVSNVATTTATIGWTETGTATQWQIEYGTGNSFSIGTGTREIASANPYMLGTTTPLTPSSQYTYFVRAICGPNDTSAWSVRSPLFSTIATCDTPTAPVATNLTSSTADLGWTENGTASQWEIEYAQGATFSQGTGTRIIVNANPYTLGSATPLMANTAYSYFVRSICGANDTSQWSPRRAFTTACAGITSLPWTENFDMLTSTGITSFPACWSKQNGDWSTSAASNYNNSYSAPNHLRCAWAATNEYMWTPGFDLMANTSYDFSFYVAGDGWTGWNVDVFHNTVQNSTGATQLGSTFTAPGSGTLTKQPYTRQVYTFVPPANGTYYFALRVNQPGSPWYIAFDDFRVEITPTCPAPQMPTSTNITTVSADISRVSATGAPQWQIEYGPIPYTTGTGQVVTANTDPFTLTGLSAGTEYAYFVRDICTPGDTSSWTVGLPFMTLCGTAQGPYSQFFNLSSTPNCWTNSTTPESWLFANAATSNNPDYGVEGSDDHTGNGGYYAWVDGSGNGTSQDITLTSVPIDITGFSTPNLSYFMKSFNSNDGALNKLVVEVYDGSNWIQIDSVQQNYPNANWYNRQVALPALSTNTIQVRFVVDEFNNNGGNAYNNDILIDDIMITNGPLAIRLDQFSATNTGASNKIVWNTLSEEGSDRFELERSIDGKNFSKIYEKQANGKPSRYVYLDEAAAKGINYYRLRMLEANGTAVYSKTVSAFLNAGDFNVQAFPNPVSHELTVKVNGVQGTNPRLQVTDLTGKVIKTVNMDGSVKQVNMSGLASGIYLIKYADANYAQTIRVHKQ